MILCDEKVLKACKRVDSPEVPSKRLGKYCPEAVSVKIQDCLINWIEIFFKVILFQKKK